MTSAAWAWIGLALGIVAYVVIWDLTQPESLTRQMHDWLLYSAVWGPVLVGLWVAAPVALVYHFFTRHYPKG